MSDIKKGKRFSPSLCVTHLCNLNCIYCYQKHDGVNRMTFETAKNCVDWIFSHVPEDMYGVELSFIGGEPLLEFDLEKELFEYCEKSHSNYPYIFYATTNGTLLDDKKKDWFSKHKDKFVLGLSLDGMPDTHNHNRSNSYIQIDPQFFINTWPDQGIKMTISDYSLLNLADNIIYLHKLGFKEIDGVNLFEGTFDWSDEKYIRLIIPQLKKLVDFYVEHDELQLDQMLGRQIDMCEEENKVKRKWCGIGTGALFFDTDGKQYPCPFTTPMTFSQDKINDILKTDFHDTNTFVDDDCFNNCYIYPVCPHCPGANYLVKGTFKNRDRSKCRMQKLITLFSADLLGRRIIKNRNCIPANRIFNTIVAITKIKENILPELKEYENLLNE